MHIEFFDVVEPAATYLVFVFNDLCIVRHELGRKVEYAISVEVLFGEAVACVSKFRFKVFHCFHDWCHIKELLMPSYGATYQYVVMDQIGMCV